ncbi:shikimate kinase [Streptococcus salivarius]|uniref:shikimate kinase n=1 Tax=Streptococcus salivarius TaxID=1304 RepID=UPI001E425B66|nr:shikimate kinase [Streptococcus salivarius]
MAKVLLALWELVRVPSPHTWMVVSWIWIRSEEKIGMSIADFFLQKKVRQPFVRLSLRLLEELLQEGDDVIISTGGGVVVGA